MNRRDFAAGLAAVAGTAVVPRCFGAAAASKVQIDVLLNEPVGQISPDLYGYLLENLGTVIYDGVWVGENSKIPNYSGIRKELVDRLRAIKAGVIRWPGGEFADYYDWTDGIGPRSARPRRTNKWSNYLPADAPANASRYDTNQFGTPEFMHLCELTGGRPYLNVNTRSSRPQDFNRWLEYCNSPEGSTSYSDKRKADGSAKPYGVRYWGIGNEPWAAGGELTVEEYATDYKRFTTEVSGYGVDLALIACGGPPGPSTQWVSEFLRICENTYMPVPVFAMSLHYYATFLNDLPFGKFAEMASKVENYATLFPNAIHYDVDGWYDSLAKSALMTSRIDSTWQAIREAAPKRNIKIAIDEWGCMYNSENTALNPSNVTGRAVTLRDAITAAITLNAINAACDKVSVANFTGLINQEGGIFQATEEHFVCTPIYHVFSMFSGHQGGRALRTSVQAPSISYRAANDAQSTVDGCFAGASIQEDRLTITIVNPHASESLECEIQLRGGEAVSAELSILADPDIHAQNTFENPDRIRVRKGTVSLKKPVLRCQIPPASVSKLSILLRSK
jgi:alpha-N-arabinofuranosidase